VPPRLKLRAADAEDLAVMSAILQDAVVPADEIAYLSDERRFVLVANRFRWEDADPIEVPGRIYERIHCALVIDEVRAVRTRNFDKRRGERIYALLAVELRDGAVELAFSAGATIRVEFDRLACSLEDVGEPYPTRWRPRHALARD
jgi:hypothetical protein